MLLMCLATAFSVTWRAAPIEALDRPSAISASTSFSRVGEPVQRLVALPGHHRGDHLGVEHGAAVEHLAHAVDELPHVGDPVLEQVADRALAAGQQLAGVELLDVLREHQHREARPARAHRDRGAQPLVGERRRHPHVEDGAVHVGVGQRDVELDRVVDRVDDLEARALEQLDQAGAEEGVVLGEDEARTHGTSRVTIVGPPSGLDTAIVPSKAASRRITPRMPVPGVGVGAAAAVVADHDPEQPCRRAPSSTQACWWPACLAELARHSATAK